MQCVKDGAGPSLTHCVGPPQPCLHRGTCTYLSGPPMSTSMLPSGCTPACWPLVPAGQVSVAGGAEVEPELWDTWASPEAAGAVGAAGDAALPEGCDS